MQAIEAFEDALALFQWDSRAAIFDFQDGLNLIRRDRHSDLSLHRRIANRVIQQIGDQLLQQHLVATDDNAPLRSLTASAKPAAAAAAPAAAAEKPAAPAPKHKRSMKHKKSAEAKDANAGK